jgi:hypothetical protein
VDPKPGSDLRLSQRDLVDDLSQGQLSQGDLADEVLQ